MASRFRPAKRRAPPNYQPAVDWSNPITRGMSLLAVSKSGTMVDVLTGIRGTPTGSTLPVSAPTGNGTDGTTFAGGIATASYVNFGTDVRSKDMSISGGTVFAWGRPTTNGGIAERNDGNAIGGGWIFALTNTFQLALLVEYPVVNMTCSTVGTVPTDFPTSMAVAFDSYPTTTAAVSMYIGGQAQSMNQHQSGTGGSTSDAAYNQYVGRSTFNSAAPPSMVGSYGGNLEFVACWNRRLSDAEIASLHADRGQLFAAPKVLGFAQPAASGVTVNLTGTSSTAAVGTPVANRSLADTGNAATGASGTVGLSHTNALAGNAATGTPGSVSADNTVSVATTGTQAAGAVGTMALQRSAGLTGQQTVASVGIAAVDRIHSLSGALSTGSTGAVTATNSNVTVGLSGVYSTGHVGLVYFGVPPVLAEQTPTLIITSASSVDVSMAINSVETSVSL